MRDAAIARLLVAIAPLAIVQPTPLFAQPSGMAVATRPPAAYGVHQQRAAAAAHGIGRNILKFCALGDRPPPRSGAPAPIEPAAAPFRAFDNLYFVGLSGVSAWAIDTSAGIILIDALNNSKDAETVIVPGLRKLGLDPARLRYIVVTHAHGDHYGGAQYLADRFKARVISSDADWKLMASRTGPASPNWSAPPKRDMTITDGQTLRLGDTAVSLFITPGHTPGTISLIFPVRDQGRPHMAALWGGTAFNFAPTAANYRIYAASADRFRALVAKHGVDVLLSNHGGYDDTAANRATLAARRPGQPNPYVIGGGGARDFLTVASECAQARGAAVSR